MERARRTFHAMVAHASAEDLRRRSNGTRWTNRQLLWHMVFGYLIVRTLMHLVRILGRLGWSRRFAGTLNAARRPFHVINYLGSCAGGLILRPTAMASVLDRSIPPQQTAHSGEHPTAGTALHVPPTGTPLRPPPCVLDLYPLRHQHFDHPPAPPDASSTEVERELSADRTAQPAPRRRRHACAGQRRRCRRGVPEDRRGPEEQSPSSTDPAACARFIITLPTPPRRPAMNSTSESSNRQRSWARTRLECTSGSGVLCVPTVTAVHST